MAFPKSKIKTSALLVAIGVSSINTSMAAGFRIPEITAVGTGTSNALVANDTEVGALAYNPAAMSFHSGKALNIGIQNINYDLEVTPAGGSKTDSVGEDTFFIPNLFFMAEGSNGKSFGLAINAPFGLETGYKAGTFPTFPGPISIFEPALSKIKMVNINPNVSFKIDNTSSFAFGIDYYDLKDLTFNSQDLFITGKGSDFGFNLGYLKKIGNWNFGLSYRSSVTVDLKGSSDLSAVAPLVPPPAPVPMAVFAEVEFPDMLQVGASYKVSDALTIELDIENTGWSSFGKIDIKNSGGTVMTTTTNNWEDTTSYKLGVIYQLNPKTKLLFGYSDDETPQPDDYYSARVPDNDRTLTSIGVTYDISKDMTFEASYMNVDIDERNINSTTVYNPAVDSDPNGTNAYNGDYDAGATVLAFGLTMKF